MKKARHIFLKFLRILIYISGILFFVLIILAFTTVPFHVKHWLGTHKGLVNETPSLIILMGGSGMPSEDGLIRTYYTAMLSQRYPEATIIIALPGDPGDTTDSPYLIKQELLLRGIPGIKIHFENQGRNTRQQAMKIAELYPEHDKSLAIVTSPEHMYRSILAFQKTGFIQVKGFPTYSISIEDDQLIFNDHELKGTKGIPPIGHNKQFRYQFWNHLTFEIQVIREGFALLYYRVRSWI